MINPPSTQTAPWSTRFMGLAAAIAAVISLAHPSATRQFTWPWVGLLALLWLIPVAGISAALIRRTFRKFPNLLVSTGLLLLALTTLLSAALSPFSNLSLLRVWPTLAGVAFFFWLYDWLADADKASRTKLVTSNMTGFGAILSVISLVGWRWQSAGQSGIVRNDVPFGHSTYTAGAMVLILPWLIQAAFSTTGVKRWGWITMSAAGFAALFATSSRGGVMAIGAVGLSTLVLVLVRAPWSRRTKLLLVVATTVVLASAVSLNPRLRELVHRGGWDEGSRASNSQRKAMIQVGERMGQTRPWIGWGPGTVPLVYPQMRSQLSEGVDNVLQLHNTPMQIWATLGIGGVLALCLLACAVIQRSLKLARIFPTGRDALTAAASIGGYALFSLTDHQLDLPAMNLLLTINLVVFFQNEPRGRAIPQSPGFRLVAVFITVALIISPLWLTSRDLFARQAYSLALSYFEEGQSGAGIAELEIAAQRAPYDPYYRHELASQLLKQRARKNDSANLARLASAATAQLEQSLATGGFQEFAHLNLGWLALDDAKPRQAAQHFIAAAHEAPHRSGVYFGLGLSLRAAGYESLAVRAFALEWINDPIAYTAPVWEWPDFASLRLQVEREADLMATELAMHNPQAKYVQGLWRWWTTGAPLSVAGYNPETSLFVETVATLAQNHPARIDINRYTWGELLEAWQQPPNRTVFATLGGNDLNFTNALVRRKQRHPFPDWHGFLTAGLENENDFLVSSLSTRSGYGVLALHPDGPVLNDLYLKQQNRFTSTFASTLFPQKGWIPAWELINLLPGLPVTER